MSHYREECEHGLVGGQCRCASPTKTVRRVPCAAIRDHDGKALAKQYEDPAYAELRAHVIAIHQLRADRLLTPAELDQWHDRDHTVVRDHDPADRRVLAILERRPAPPPTVEHRVRLEWLLSEEVRLYVDGRRLGDWSDTPDGMVAAGAHLMGYMSASLYAERDAEQERRI